MFRKNGHHLAKRVKAPMYPIHSKWGNHHHHNAYNVNWMGEGDGFEPPKGNLSRDQYRYFQGCESENANFSKCRFCEQWFTSEAQRVLHAKQFNCLAKFNDAIKIWLGNPKRNQPTLVKCAACGDDTYNRKWGIPLCIDNKCYEKWMFSMVTPMALNDIIKKMRYEADKDAKHND